MRMNQLMARKYNSVSHPFPPLPDALERIHRSGFTCAHGCHFLTALWGGNYDFSPDMHVDRTGYECFINHIHIDDFVESDNLRHGLLLIQCTFNEWNTSRNASPLVAILSLEDDAATVRFHTDRANEHWVTDNLEGYSQEILVIGSSFTNWPAEGFE